MLILILWIAAFVTITFSLLSTRLNLASLKLDYNSLERNNDYLQDQLIRIRGISVNKDLILVGFAQIKRTIDENDIVYTAVRNIEAHIQLPNIVKNNRQYCSLYVIRANNDEDIGMDIFDWEDMAITKTQTLIDNMQFDVYGNNLE